MSYITPVSVLSHLPLCASLNEVLSAKLDFSPIVSMINFSTTTPQTHALSHLKVYPSGFVFNICVRDLYGVKVQGGPHKRRLKTLSISLFWIKPYCYSFANRYLQSVRKMLVIFIQTRVTLINAGIGYKLKSLPTIYHLWP